MNPLVAFFRWLLQGPGITTLFTGAFLVSSALAVIASSHQTRNMYREIQMLQQEQDNLQSEYEKLLLEQSALANNGRVYQVARGELNMIPPALSKIVLVEKK